eukprot:CAMPEP_0183790676 /NCGR_PEP_ID=MMETSP0803_2-20130417/1268_1 /TAXON_ID=195967 /ORGANISM="Crustomastix stigmata, Strain CCMP3273" /LENGTH=287 /DNA_ID=CAMNT_0026034929 /DNA_START=44 /DNA_END=904 /DNA_ORIENTATION=-
MGDINKANELIKKGEKKLKSFMAGMFGNKYEDAVEYFEKAANIYKVNKAWNEAGETFLRMSECHLKCDSQHEAASACVDAANCFKKTDQSRAVASFEMAIKHFMEMGRLSIAAKHYKDMGEILEAEGEAERAVRCFEKAADLYEGEEVSSTANQCKLKVAALSAEAEQYDRARDVFEEVAGSSVNNNLLKYSVKGYLLQAGICVLCKGDDVLAAVARYEDLDCTFADTREHKLLTDLGGAVAASDPGAFTAVIKEFDSMSRLDNWKTTMLLRAKKGISARELEMAGE